MNGQLTGYSRLSRVIEVEGLLATAAMRNALWKTVDAMSADVVGVTDTAQRALAKHTDVAGGLEDHRTNVL